ncbi:MAG: hypothetical protein AB2L26_04195 [Ignavibacteria bacterium]
MVKNKYSDFYYVIIDDEKKKYNCFIPSMPSHYWNEKVIEAKQNGSDIRAFQIEKESIANPNTYLPDYEFSDSFLVEIPEDKSKEYKKKLPNYAKGVNLKRVIIINCCYCNAKYGELNVDFPGTENVQKGKYSAKCLSCGQEVDDFYNWYRD